MSDGCRYYTVPYRYGHTVWGEIRFNFSCDDWGRSARGAVYPSQNNPKGIFSANVAQEGTVALSTGTVPQSLTTRKPFQLEDTTSSQFSLLYHDDDEANLESRLGLTVSLL